MGLAEGLGPHVTILQGLCARALMEEERAIRLLSEPTTEGLFQVLSGVS